MRSLVTAVIAAIEAVAAAAVGLAVVVVPAMLLWMVTFSLAAEPQAVFAGASAVWALGHFAPLSFTLSPEAALSFGLPPQALEFGMSLAPLGVTLVTVLLAVRAGWRFGGRGGVGGAGVLGAGVGFGDRQIPPARSTCHHVVTAFVAPCVSSDCPFPSGQAGHPSGP